MNDIEETRAGAQDSSSELRVIKVRLHHESVGENDRACYFGYTKVTRRLRGAAMGLTILEIEVGNPANPEITERVEFLIDSGALYSVVPGPVLERLGIKPVSEQTFRLADGTKIVRKKGIALFKYGDRIGGADVIFGEEGDHLLLGSFTLEALGLSLDPLRRELKPLPMILANSLLDTERY
jgi:predicted aspartyl protease